MIGMRDERKEVMRQRTKKYASLVIRFYCELPKNRLECQVLGKQLLRSGTSVAANYREASRARSDAEFIAKIEICAQEADETLLWLELLRDDCGIISEKLTWLLDESNQFISIFVTMSKNVKKKCSYRYHAEHYKSLPFYLSLSGFSPQVSSLRSQVSSLRSQVSSLRFQPSGLSPQVSAL
jgi:four helix bundle protein